MCMSATNFTGNATLVCQVGDLNPGQRFRDPDGNEFLVTDHPANGFILAVNVSTGHATNIETDVKLGTDRMGRLYASRKLNPNKYPPVSVPPVSVPAAKLPADVDTFDGKGIAKLP